MATKPKSLSNVGKGRDVSGAKLPRYGHAWDELSAHVRRVEPLCRLCLAAGVTTPAVCVDHIKPLARGGDLLDPQNLQPLCAECHDRKTLTEIAAGYRRGEHASRVVILCGPPKAGLTHHVRTHAREEDHVFEWRDVEATLRLGKAREAMRRVREAVLQAAADGHLPGRLWLTMTDRDQAAKLARRYGATLEMLATDQDTCLERLRDDVARRKLTQREADELRTVITRWHANADAASCPARPASRR